MINSTTALEVKTLLARMIAPDIPADTIRDDAPLLDGEIGLDSIVLIDFIAKLEDLFAIRFLDDDLVPSSFRSIATLVSVIDAKKISSSG